MAYATRNFKTKAELKRAVSAGEEIGIQQAGTCWPDYGRPSPNGTAYVEGPWYPESHRWYAQVTLRNGIIVKVR